MVGQDTHPLLSTVVLEDQAIASACEELLQCAKIRCRKVEKTELPPFWEINYTILLIDESKTYS